MYTKTVLKLWMGSKVSIRDYERDNAIGAGGLILKHDGQEMIVTVEELKKLEPSGKAITSKFDRPYKLIDIEWKPRDVNQMELAI